MKRGQMEYVAKWIIFLVILIILFVFFYQIRKDLFVKPTEDINCAAQVRASAAISDIRKGKVAPDITCPTREVIFKSGVKDITIHEELADEMKWCWDTWGNGELVLFNEDGTYCHICSVARFEGNRQVPGFREYLHEEIVPRTEVTYMEYFSPQYLGTRYMTEEGKHSRLREEQILTTPFEMSQDHAIIFYQIRGERQVKDFFIKMSQDAIDRPAAAIGAGGAAFAIGGTIAGGAAFVACGVVTLSACWWISGGVALAAGSMAGIPTAYLAQEIADDPPHHMALLVFRPLETSDIDSLGCEYSFAGRR